jgi:hypothetical protein
VVASQPIPGKPLSFRRVLALFVRTLLWSLAALLIVLVSSCIIELNPKLKRTLYGPDHLASVTLDSGKLTVSVELTNTSPIGKAEYERRLIVSMNGSEAVADLTYDHGGFSDVNLYQTSDGKFALADSFDAKLITLSPLTIADYSESYLGNRNKGLYGKPDLRDNPYRKDSQRRLGNLLESNYFDNLFYLGSFQFWPSASTGQRQAWVWSFVPAAGGEDSIRDPGG